VNRAVCRLRGGGAILLALAIAACAPGTVPAPPTATAVPCPPDRQALSVRVGNTGGAGVTLHRLPDLDFTSHELSYPDDTALTVLEFPVEGEGVIFAHVRTDEGVEGYLPVRYLLAQAGSACFVSPTATAAPPRPTATPRPRPALPTPRR
jgi:hypothetical protein